MVERDEHPDASAAVVSLRDESAGAVANVDVTLIDEMLRLTVKQRLEQNDRMATLVVRLRRAFAAGDRSRG